MAGFKLKSHKIAINAKIFYCTNIMQSKASISEKRYFFQFKVRIAYLAFNQQTRMIFGFFLHLQGY